MSQRMVVGFSSGPGRSQGAAGGVRKRTREWESGLLLENFGVVWELSCNDRAINCAMEFLSWRGSNCRTTLESVYIGTHR